MTADDPGRAPEDGGPPADREDDRNRWPTGSESPREVGRNVLWGLASAYVGRVMFLQSLIWLMVGGGLLAGAWTLVRGEMERREDHDRISFAAPELLWKVLTAKRWELLKALCGAGPVSIRESARRVGRDVKAVHGDVTALLEAGLLDRTPDGRIELPYDAVKVEFLLSAA